LDSRWSRRILACAIFVAVAGAEFALVNIPQPLQLERETITASKDRSELIIRLAEGGDGQLLSFDGKKDVVVDVDFERAVVDPATSFLIRAAGYAAPAGEHWAAYRTESTSRVVPSRVCQSFVDVKRADTGRPAEMHLYQDGPAGEDRFRRICIRVTGSGSVVRMKTEYNPDGRADDPGCNKQLVVDDWTLAVSNVPVTMVVPEGRSFCVTLQPATEAAAFVSAPDAMFNRLRLSETISVSDVRVTRTQPARNQIPPVVQVQPDDETILTARSLAIGSDKLEVTLEADRAWVWRDGKQSTYSVLERMQKYPVISVLIGALNAAILAAIRRLFLSNPGKASAQPVAVPS
jgi:hypothetical protein